VSPFLVVLSSPSGAGKTTIARALLERRDDLGFSVSATTRPPRSTEQDGVDYHFLSQDEFMRRVTEGGFLESAEYSGHLYGTLEDEVDRMLAQGRHVMLDIEVQGAAQIRQRRSDVVSIFVLPPSADALVGRLQGRAADDREALSRRLIQADTELQQAATYDHVVVNDDLDTAVATVAAIIDAEEQRTARRPDLAAMIDKLRADLAIKASELTP
jgi:guanylate kinase